MTWDVALILGIDGIANGAIYLLAGLGLVLIFSVTRVVFVPFCNEGISPDARSEEGEYLEAERKLFYVSMTRASEHLVVSWADFRPDTGRRQAPSPFVIEAGLAVPPKTSPRTAERTPSAATTSRARMRPVTAPRSTETTAAPGSCSNAATFAGASTVSRCACCHRSQSTRPNAWFSTV